MRTEEATFLEQKVKTIFSLQTWNSLKLLLSEGICHQPNMPRVKQDVTDTRTHSNISFPYYLAILSGYIIFPYYFSHIIWPILSCPYHMAILSGIIIFPYYRTITSGYIIFPYFLSHIILQYHLPLLYFPYYLSHIIWQCYLPILSLLYYVYHSIFPILSGNIIFPYYLAISSSHIIFPI